MFYWKRGSLNKFRRGLVFANEGEGENQGGGANGSGTDNGSDSGDGSGSGDVWYSALPESVQGWDEVKNSDSPEKFWDQISNQRSRMGRSITIPGEDAGQEDWSAFHDKLKSKVPGLIPAPTEDNMDTFYDSLGRPEKAEAYTAPKMEIELDQTRLSAFQEMSYKAGLSNEQFGNLVKEFTTLEVTLGEQMVAQNVEAHKGLKEEWGNDYDRRMSVATNIAKLTDAPAGIVEILEQGNGTPADYKWFYSLAERFKGEGSNLAADTGTNNQQMTPSEAKDKINEIKRNKEHPYWNKMAPGHEEAVTKMQKLYELVHPAG